MSDRDMGGWISFYIIIAVSILIAVLLTHIVYQTNEKKYKRILERENQSGNL